MITKHANKVKTLSTIEAINVVGSGINTPTDNERTKTKITKPLYKSL